MYLFSYFYKYSQNVSPIRGYSVEILHLELGREYYKD